MRLVLAPASSRSSSLLTLSSSSFDSLPLREPPRCTNQQSLSYAECSSSHATRGYALSKRVPRAPSRVYVYTRAYVCVELVLCAPVTHPSFAVFALALASSNAFCGPGNAARYCVASRDTLLNSFPRDVSQTDLFPLAFFLPSSIWESLLITRDEYLDSLLPVFFSICIYIYACTVARSVSNG